MRKELIPTAGVPDRFEGVISGNVKAKYLKIHIVNQGICPEGHPGQGSPAWLFVDEIIIN